jgi:hypothetical protein
VSNIEGRIFYERIQEWSVPLRDGKCTARDLADLLRTADKQIAEVEPNDLQYDDRFMVQADEDRLFVQIRKDWKP